MTSIHGTLATIMGLDQKVGSEDGLDRLRERFPFRPTLFIGLGGTGCATVSKVKRLFRELLQPNLVDGASGADPEIIDKRYAFLGFDTEAGGKKVDGLQPGQEWFHTGVADLSGFYSGVGQQPGFADWVMDGYPPTCVVDGAGGIRNIGRLAFVYNATLVSEALENKLEQIMVASAQPDTVAHSPVVFVFGSLTGGTGSGGFLDLCFLLREKLRHVGNAKLIGHLALLDGVAGMIPMKKTQALSNTFGALKELDAFMKGDTPGVNWGATIDYPGGSRGWVTRPFDECFLLSPYRGDGAKNLTTPDHVSSFMARYTFMMSAHSFPPESENASPDYHGIMVNHADLLEGEQHGAAHVYLVPGMAQVHFPVELVANAVLLSAARRYSAYLGEGGSDEVGREAARNFSRHHKISAKGISDAAQTYLRDLGEPEAGVKSYDTRVLELLESDTRYKRGNEILKIGSDTLISRESELADFLRPFTEAAVNEAVSGLRDRLRTLLGATDGLIPAASAFLEELSLVVSEELAIASPSVGGQIGSRLGELQAQWQRVEPLVRDVVTDDGVLDRFQDRWKVDDATAAYGEFLNAAETLAHERARMGAAEERLCRMSEEIESLLNELKTFKTVELDRAHVLLKRWEGEANRLLSTEEKGATGSVEDITSHNVLDEEWRAALQQRLLGDGAAIHSVLLQAGGHPATLMGVPTQDDQPGSALAVRLVELLNEGVFSGVGEWSMTKLLVEGGAADPLDRLAHVISRTLRPQMRLAGMKNQVQLDPMAIQFSGGLDEDIRDRLAERGSLSLAQLKIAENHESHRINFFSATLPVALAGCDIVSKTFEPAYDRWRKEVDAGRGTSAERLNNLRRYHCFPQAWMWRSPTTVFHGYEEELTLFAQSLAVSHILEVSEGDAKRMRAVKRGKNLAYGLYQISSSHFWVWPFFAASPIGSEGPPEARWRQQDQTSSPLRLGSNVQEAYASFGRSESARASCRLWVDWFNESWNYVHKGGSEINERKRLAILECEKRMGRTTDQTESEIWVQIIEILRNWEL